MYSKSDEWAVFLSGKIIWHIKFSLLLFAGKLANKQKLSFIIGSSELTHGTKNVSYGKTLGRI